jgi:hypothetical protein
MDLLTTYTHDSELLALTALSLANTPQLVIPLNYSAISSQPRLQNSTDTLLQLSWLKLLGTDHIENTVLLFLRSCPLQR